MTGEWKGYANIIGTYGATTIEYVTYTFNNDGSFVFESMSVWGNYKHKGKYSAANGKISIYDIETELINSAEPTNNVKNPVEKIMEYEIGTDDKGVYLFIPFLNRFQEETYVAIPNRNEESKYRPDLW